MNRDTQLAQRILEEQGYLLLAWMHGPLPTQGSIIASTRLLYDSTDPINGPLYVADHATAQEYLSQANKYCSYEYDPSYVDRAIGFLKVVAE